MGVVLFNLLTGDLPFEHKETNKLYQLILAGEYTIPEHISKEGKDLLKNILETNTNKRFNFD